VAGASRPAGSEAHVIAYVGHHGLKDSCGQWVLAKPEAETQSVIVLCWLREHHFRPVCTVRVRNACC